MRKVLVTGWTEKNGVAYSITDSVSNPLTFGSDEILVAKSPHKKGSYSEWAYTFSDGYLFLNKGYLYKVVSKGEEHIISAEKSYVALPADENMVHVSELEGQKSAVPEVDTSESVEDKPDPE